MRFEIKVTSHLSFISFLTYRIRFLYKSENSLGNRTFTDNNHHEDYSEQILQNKQCEFSVIVMKTNIEESPACTYHLYKKRVQIEQMFDD